MDGFLSPVLISGAVYYKPVDNQMVEYGSARIGEILACHISEDRDLVEHRRFFAILRACVHSLPQYNIVDKRGESLAVEDLRIALCYETGFTRSAKDLQGRERVYPRSLSFKNTSEADFREYRQRSYAVLCRLLGCELDELMSMGVENI